MKVIFYIDMNSFFVSCHEVSAQWLKNKPVVVCNNSKRAVVSSASYEARKYDIKSGIPFYIAKKNCPDLIQIPIDHKLYTNYSLQILEFLKTNITDNVENNSIDEFCLDVTSIYSDYQTVVELAKEIQKKIFLTFDLPCSIGISYNKFLAKIASKVNKPQGICVFSPKNLKSTFWNLDIRNLYGIGSLTAKKLKNINIKTIGAFANYQNHDQLKNIMGKKYYNFVLKANGKTILKEEQKIHERKSIGHDTTLEEDLVDIELINQELKKIAFDVAARAKKLLLFGCVIICSFRDKNFKWWSKQTQIRWHTNDESVIYFIAKGLFLTLWKGENVRALRVSIKKIVFINDLYHPDIFLTNLISKDFINNSN